MDTEEYDLSGHVSIVTGGGRGIGRAIALSLAKAGAAKANPPETRATVFVRNLRRGLGEGLDSHRQPDACWVEGAMDARCGWWAWGLGRCRFRPAPEMRTIPWTDHSAETQAAGEGRVLAGGTGIIAWRRARRQAPWIGRRRTTRRETRRPPSGAPRRRIAPPPDGNRRRTGCES